jgi:gluconolactonase
MQAAFEIYSNDVFEFINRDFELKQLADDCLFTEGPVWNQSGHYLFSDITDNRIYRISEDSTKEIFIRNSGTSIILDPDLKQDQTGSNGLAYDPEGNLIICRHGAHGIGRYDGKSLEPFVEFFRGRPFNSPNDLIVHDNGSVYFSDPPYGLKDGKINPSSFQPLAGVYCYRDDRVQLFCDKYLYPNGVCLSNDQKMLFVCSTKPFEKFISVLDTATNEFKGIFAEENSDGMKTDSYDNLYLCTKEGILILNRSGERMALIKLPSIPANACWGGSSGCDLFVTARENVFLIKGLQKL